jgi:hypothetical protein
MSMTYSILPSEIDFQDYAFDFEEYVRNEVGLDITSTAKKNGGTSLSSLFHPSAPFATGKLFTIHSPLLSTMDSVAKINDVVLWRHQHLFCPHSNSIGYSLLLILLRRGAQLTVAVEEGIDQLLADKDIGGGDCRRDHKGRNITTS